MEISESEAKLRIIESILAMSLGDQETDESHQVVIYTGIYRVKDKYFDDKGDLFQPGDVVWKGII